MQMPVSAQLWFGFSIFLSFVDVAYVTEFTRHPLYSYFIHYCKISECCPEFPELVGQSATQDFLIKAATAKVLQKTCCYTGSCLTVLHSQS